MLELYVNVFDFEVRIGFVQNLLGFKGSFYGVGLVNQGVEMLVEVEQDKVVCELVEKVWLEVVMCLVVQCIQEIRDFFLLVVLLYCKVDKIVREYSIGLNLEYKNNVFGMGKMKFVEQFLSLKVMVIMKLGLDLIVLVQIIGFFIF